MSVGLKSSGSKGADVVIDRDAPAALIGFASPRIGFAGRDRANASAVQAERPAASGAAEQVYGGAFSHPTRSLSARALRRPRLAASSCLAMAGECF